MKIIEEDEPTLEFFWYLLLLCEFLFLTSFFVFILCPSAIFFHLLQNFFFFSHEKPSLLKKNVSFLGGHRLFILFHDWIFLEKINSRIYLFTRNGVFLKVLSFFFFFLFGLKFVRMNNFYLLFLLYDSMLRNHYIVLFFFLSILCNTVTVQLLIDSGETIWEYYRIS